MELEFVKLEFQPKIRTYISDVELRFKKKKKKNHVELEFIPEVKKKKKKKKKKTQMELDCGKHDFGYFLKMETEIDKIDF